MVSYSLTTPTKLPKELSILQVHVFLVDNSAFFLKIIPLKIWKFDNLFVSLQNNLTHALFGLDSLDFSRHGVVVLFLSPIRNDL